MKWVIIMLSNFWTVGGSWDREAEVEKKLFHPDPFFVILELLKGLQASKMCKLEAIIQYTSRNSGVSKNGNDWDNSREYFCE